MFLKAPVENLLTSITVVRASACALASAADEIAAAASSCAAYKAFCRHNTVLQTPCQQVTHATIESKEQACEAEHGPTTLLLKTVHCHKQPERN